MEATPIQPSELSKRAARRIIQRAFVLVGRERAVRQHLREVELITLWVIEDLDLEWTLILNHGTLEFHRGRSAKPQLTLVWSEGARFFAAPEPRARGDEGFEKIGDAAHWKTLEPVYRSLGPALSEVLRNPVDDQNDPLV